MSTWTEEQIEQMCTPDIEIDWKNATREQIAARIQEICNELNASEEEDDE